MWLCLNLLLMDELANNVKKKVKPFKFRGGTRESSQGNFKASTARRNMCLRLNRLETIISHLPWCGEQKHVFPLGVGLVNVFSNKVTCQCSTWYPCIVLPWEYKVIRIIILPLLIYIVTNREIAVLDWDSLLSNTDSEGVLMVYESDTCLVSFYGFVYWATSCCPQDWHRCSFSSTSTKSYREAASPHTDLTVFVRRQN